MYKVQSLYNAEHTCKYTNNWDDGEYRQEEEEEQNPEGNDW